MFKPISISDDAFRAGQQAAHHETAVNNVFKVMHGFFGNLFLSKFANGQTNDAGEDTGVVSARQIWAHGLRDFDLSTVKTALARVMADHPEFPPSLPQFVALCKASQVRRVAPESQPRLGMDDALKAASNAKARADALAEYQRRVDAKKRATDATDGLPMLRQLIAQAVALAGGDEALTLRKLEAA